MARSIGKVGTGKLLKSGTSAGAGLSVTDAYFIEVTDGENQHFQKNHPYKIDGGNVKFLLSADQYQQMQENSKYRIYLLENYLFVSNQAV